MKNQNEIICSDFLKSNWNNKYKIKKKLVPVKMKRPTQKIIQLVFCQSESSRILVSANSSIINFLKKFHLEKWKYLPNWSSRNWRNTWCKVSPIEHWEPPQLNLHEPPSPWIAACWPRPFCLAELAVAKKLLLLLLSSVIIVRA